MNVDREILDRYEHLQEIVRSAILHSEGEKHNDIAEMLGTSSVRVARAIKEVIELGILEIQVNPPNDREVARELRDKYEELREAYVYPIGIEDEIMGVLAHQSAAYLEKLLNDGKESINRIAIGPGRTMLALVRALSTERRQDVTVCSTTTAEHVETYLASNIIIGIPAWKWECKLERFDPILTAARKRDYADLLIFGTGKIGDMEGVTPLSHLAYRNVDKSELEGSLVSLIKDGGAGIINYQHIYANGKPIPWKENLKLEKTVLKLDLIREMAKDENKRVVCVAGGADKAEAIKAALKGKYFNVLITDYETANALL